MSRTFIDRRNRINALISYVKAEKGSVATSDLYRMGMLTWRVSKETIDKYLRDLVLMDVLYINDDSVHLKEGKEE